MSRYRIFRYLMMAAVILAAASSCGGDDDDIDFLLRPSGGGSNPGTTVDGGGQTVTEALTYTRRIEVPRLLDGNLFVQHSVAYQGDSVMNYCLEYDPVAHHSRWIAFRFDAITRQQNTGRSAEPFIDDPSIPSQYWIGNNGFGSRYTTLDGQSLYLPSRQFDRGHLCASADRYLSREANEQTFYMSNMSPQMSNFNSPYWSSFEQYVQKRGRDAAFADTLYVVKGGTIAEGQILGHVSRYNGSQVVVPQYYFMALLKCKNDAYSAIAFWMEHRDYGTSDLSLQQIGQRAISIDELEALTGIDFFPNLPDNVEQTVEQTIFKAAWGL